ncbi:hypothetical protein [Streptomyces venezuelae]|uniref:hypothetical protein n=1 Tax=Streptomyces venezuelae TaxID=54571 RepID=UPI001682C5C0|nr:hypothetical protein [Streptomyces venezuelae]
MLTDRDERARLAAAENRIARPLRIRDGLASVRRILGRRSQDRAQERESVACQPTTPHTPVHP